MKSFVWKNSYSFRRFLWFYIQRKFTSVRLYQLINRTSPEFQPMHAYGQQSWPLFHRCGSLFLFLNSWRWIVSKSSNEIDHHRSLSKPRENQNTIEKNEFYEWKIWRTIMKTMNENNFICIKINSWLSTIELRQHPFLSSIHTDQFFQQLVFLWSNESFASTLFYHRFHTNQHFNSWFLRNQTRISSSLISIIDPYRSTSDQLVLRCNRTSASTFVNRSIDHKFWSYKDFFWWFSYRRIFSPIFLHESKLIFIQFVLSLW